MIIKKKIIFIILISLLIFQSSYSENTVSIIYKVNQKIITTLDVKKEENYLLALNNQLKNLDKKKIFEIAKESALREKIKKIELDKYYELSQKNPFLDTVIEDFFMRLGLKNKDEFEAYLLPYDLTISEIKKKIEVETTWNELIFTKYKNELNIDKEKMKKRIRNKTNKKTLFLLSEIVFKKNQGDDMKKKITNIYESINEIGFKNTANIYSSSDSAKFGGNIGWVDKNNLSKKILKLIENIEVKNHTKPIPISNGYLILRLEEIKEQIIKVDQDKELKQMIKYETDNQLNKFSQIYYDIIKINTIINEL
jgi:peptidyl-prolyl cis-trans isomerase SurA